MDRVQQLHRVQKRALEFYLRDNQMPPESGIDHVLLACDPLTRLMDAEVRHVTLSARGLAETLTRIFVESLCALRQRKDMPDDVGEVCRVLREDVFAPRNQKYGDTFAGFGAVGVVIRLLDHVHALRDGRTESVMHIANFAAMTLVVLIDDDKEFLS